MYRAGKKINIPGYFIGLMVTLLFTARFLVEFVKNVQVDFEASMFLNMGQLLSIPFIIGGLLTMWWSMKQAKA